MDKIIGCLLLIMTTFCLNAQNKKEQIEALNFSIYSLNAVLATTRDNASKDISSLNDKIKEISDEITTLKKSNNKLTMELNEANSKIPSPDCAAFFNFPNLISIVEMDKLYKCVPPSLIKVEFYERYYEILAIEFIKEVNPLNLNKQQLLSLFRSIEYTKYFRSEKTAIQETTELDRLMENYKTGDFNSELIFHEALYRFYQGGLHLGQIDDNGELITQFQHATHDIFPEIYITRTNDFLMCVAWNAGQAGEAPHGGIYEVSEIQIREVEQAKELICKITSKLEKIFGSNCYSIIPYGKIEFVNSLIEITLPIYGEEDYLINNSGFFKFTTSDFWSYESLYYAYKKDDEQTLKWIKL